jgi:hypothetical protein
MLFRKEPWLRRLIAETSEYNLRARDLGTNLIIDTVIQEWGWVHLMSADGYIMRVIHWPASLLHDPWRITYCLMMVMSLFKCVTTFGSLAKWSSEIVIARCHLISNLTAGCIAQSTVFDHQPTSWTNQLALIPARQVHPSKSVNVSRSWNPAGADLKLFAVWIAL